MKKVLVLGAGLVSRPLVRYLLDHGYAVTVASRTVAKAEKLVAGHENGRALALNVDDVEAIARWIAGPAPYFLQQFQPNGCLDPRLERVKPYSAIEMEEMAAAARPYLGDVQLRV